MTSIGKPATAPHEVLDQLGRRRVIVVIRSESKDDALEVSRVLLEAGVTVLEITYTTPDASDVIAALRSEAGGDVLLGAGSISSADDSHRAAGAGADFLVSPGSPAPLVEAMLETGLLALPGVLTPTEVMHARSLGACAVKLFPARLVGPAGLRALLGPFPDTAFVPTGGVAPEEVSMWLDAGAHAVGLGSSVAPSSLGGRTPARDLAAQVRRLLTSTGASKE